MRRRGLCSKFVEELFPLFFSVVLYVFCNDDEELEVLTYDGYTTVESIARGDNASRPIRRAEILPSFKYEACVVAA